MATTVLHQTTGYHGHSKKSSISYKQSPLAAISAPRAAAAVSSDTPDAVPGLAPPGLTFSSSPDKTASAAAPSSSLLLPSSTSKNSSSSGSSDEAPTPRDIVQEATALVTSLNRKRRVVWDLRHRSSCASSPKHRYHPYFQASAEAPHRSSDAVNSSSSSSSPLRTTTRHRRTSSTTRGAASSIKAPRSILKCLRSGKVSQQIALSCSSPGKRALHASPGGTAVRVSASPRRRSLTSSGGSPWSLASAVAANRSPGRSPRIPSLSFNRFTITANGTKSPSLAEITRANGGGRVHTVSFPDLHAPPPASTTIGNAGGAMMMSMQLDGPSSSQTTGQQAASTSAGGNVAPSSTAVPLGSALGTPQNIGLGLGKPFEGNANSSPFGSSDSAAESDPRMQVISACHTLKHSLSAPVWVDPSVAPSVTSSGSAPEDCFDSKPFDFPPRNVEQLPQEPGQAPVPAVYLRELEAAYATIFQYAQAYIQSWYLAQPATGAVAPAQTTPDELDAQFEKLAGLVLKCIFRDLHRALNPVPVQEPEAEAEAEAEPVASTSAAAAVDNVAAQPNKADSTHDAREALLHRAGLSPDHAQNDEAAAGAGADLSSSSPLGFPIASSDPAAVAATTNKPKRVGRSTAEMRRRRNEVVVAEAALQAFGTLLSCERFWRYFGGSSLHRVIREATAITKSPLFKGPKNRDIIASYNWLVANQTMTDVASLNISSSGRDLFEPVLDEVAEAVLASIQVLVKNGEKARRVHSEGIRALRTLTLAFPSYMITLFSTSPHFGKIAFLLKYLCGPVKLLRDNTALFLASVAYALTANWDDTSANSEGNRLHASEIISMEIFKYWSLSPDQVEIDELSRHLNIALESKLAGDYHYVRLMANTLPILLGRRFRKMERKGPHMWLSKVVELKKRDEIANFGPTHAIGYHLLTFVHVAHAWAAASKEMVAKQAAASQEKHKGSAASLNVDETLWGLGDKALRVITQNIETAATGGWSREQYTGIRAEEIDAACYLVTSSLYVFTGLAQSLHAPSDTTAPDQLVRPSSAMHQDLSRLWKVFVCKHLPPLFNSGVTSIHQKGWQIMHALLRKGEEHPTEDAAIRNWTLDRAVSPRLLGITCSQAGQSTGAISAIIAQGLRAYEIPSLNLEWTYDNRREIMFMIDAMLTGFRQHCTTAQAAPGDSVAADAEIVWTKNEDGYSILPTEISTCIRAFLATMRASTGQQDSQAKPSELSLEVCLELAQFLISASEIPADNQSGTPQDGLSSEALSYSLAAHYLDLLSQAFGKLTTHSRHRQASVAGLCFPPIDPRVRLAKSQLLSVDVFFSHLADIVVPAGAAELTESAYLALIDSVIRNKDKVTAQQSAQLYEKMELYLKAGQTRLARGVWERLANALISAIATEGAAQYQDVGQQTLEMASSLYGSEIPQDRTQHAFHKLLISYSLGSAPKAWDLLQAVISAPTNTAFLSWSIVPLARKLPSLAGVESFLDQLSRLLTACIEEPEVCNLTDVALALCTGLDDLSHGDALRLMTRLQSITLQVLESSVLQVDIRTKLYQSMTDAFARAYTVPQNHLELETFAPLLMTCPTHKMDSFAAIWNATFGASEEALDYTDDLKSFLQNVSQEGNELQLPGWPKESVVVEEQVEEVDTIAESLDSAADEIIEETMILDSQAAMQVHDNTAILEALQAASVTRSVSPKAETALPVEIADAHQSTEDEGPVAGDEVNDVAELVGAEILPETQDSIDEESVSRIAETQPAQAAHQKSPQSTQIPPLSQIPDVSAVMRADSPAADTASLPMAEEKVAAVVEAEEHFEESVTSVIPETQVVHAVDITAVSDEALDTSINNGNETSTDLVPETQLPARRYQSPSPSPLPARAPSPELPEPAETQLTHVSESNLDSQSQRMRDVTPFAQPARMLMPEPTPALESLAVESSKDGLTAQKLHALEQRVVEPLALAAKPVYKAPSDVSAKDSEKGQSIPSPATTVRSAQSSSQGRRKRQTVEVVIPYKPWLPRYPSTQRLDGDSQASSAASQTSRASKPVQPVPAARKRSRDMLEQDGVPVTRELHVSKRQHTSMPKAIDSHHKYRKSESESRPLKRVASEQEMQRLSTGHHRAHQDRSSERRVRASGSLPTIIHSREPQPYIEGSDDEDDDSDASSSDDEIYVMSSSPMTSKHIRDVSDSLELSRKAKQNARREATVASKTRDEDYTPHNGKKANHRSQVHRRSIGDDEYSPTSSLSPTTAASQRIRTYSQSSAKSAAAGGGNRHSHPAARKEAYENSTEQAHKAARRELGRNFASVLSKGSDADMEDILERLSESQLKRLHQRVEGRLKDVYKIRPERRPSASSRQQS